MGRTFVTKREAIYKVIIIFYVTRNSAADAGGKGSSRSASGCARLWPEASLVHSYLSLPISWDFAER